MGSSWDTDNDGDLSDEGYNAIDGATDRILYWTPGSQIDFTNQSGQQVYVNFVPEMMDTIMILMPIKLLWMVMTVVQPLQTLGLAF